MDLATKIKTNTWDHLNDFLNVYNLMKEGQWKWGKNWACKYVELRIDMRDGGCIIRNGEGIRIDPKDLEYQFKMEDRKSSN